MTLLQLHDVLVWPLWSNEKTANDASAVLKSFGVSDSILIPYYQPGGPLKSSNDKILISSYCKRDGSCLALAGNLQDSHQRTTVCPNSKVDIRNLNRVGKRRFTGAVASESTNGSNSLRLKRDQPNISSSNPWIVKMKAKIDDALRGLKKRHLNTDLKLRIYSGFSWSLTGALSSRILALLTTIVVSRQIGRESFGELAILQSTVTTLGEVAGMGIGLAATKYISELRSSNPGRSIKNILAVCGCFPHRKHGVRCDSVFLCWGGCVQAVQQRRSLWFDQGVCFYSCVAASMCGVMTGALNGLERFRSVAKLNVMSGFLAVTAQSVMVFKSGGLAWYTPFY